ncbi:MAG: mannosyltransferase family protein [bacterium]
MFKIVKNIKFNRYSEHQSFIPKKEIPLALIMTIGLILFSILICLTTCRYMILNSTDHARYLLEPNNKLSGFANWDGVRYLFIAQHGYNESFVTGFFPLYPILISIITKITGSYFFSGILISWTSLFGVVYFYIKIVKKLFKKITPQESIRAVLYFLLFPSAIYLLFIYTESLFALLALSSIYFALDKKYLKSSLLVALATATHIRGAFLVILIGSILLEQKVKIWKIILSMAIGSIGLITYMGYLYNNFGSPIEFLKAQEVHGWLHQSIFSQIWAINTVEWFMIVGLICSIIYWWKRRRSFSLYSALFLLIPLIGGQFGGFPRYALMAFPIQLMIFSYTRNKKILAWIIVGIFAFLWAWFLILFTAGYVVS